MGFTQYQRCKSKADACPRDDLDTMKEKLKSTTSQCWGHVLYDFIPQEATEIAVTKGERVTIHNEVRGWLFIETKAGTYGYVPLKFCTVNGTAPRRDPMELKVRLSKQGHKICGDPDSKCNNNSVRLRPHHKSELTSKCLNNNEISNKPWCKERLDNDVDVSLKRAIATPIMVAYARKSTINKDYCMEAERLANSGKKNQGAPLMDTLSPPDLSSEHSETSDSISSMEETSSVNSSQPDSVRSDDVMDATPSAFLPVMLTKNPDLPVPDDSTTDSGFSMDEDIEFAESERYKQILKRKAVDVLYKQNYEALKIPPLKSTCNSGAVSTLNKQPVSKEAEGSKDNEIDCNTVRPRVPAKTIPFHQRASVIHRSEAAQQRVTPSQGYSTDNAETKRKLEALPRVPVISKPNTESSHPQGSTFLSRFAVRRSSKEILARKEKGREPPQVAKKPTVTKVASSLNRQKDTMLSRVAAKRLPGSTENLLDDKSDSARRPSARSGRRGSLDCLLDKDEVSRETTPVSQTKGNARAPDICDRLAPEESHVRDRDSSDAGHNRWSSPVKGSSFGARRWGSMECLLDRMSDNLQEKESRLISRSTNNNRTGSVECLLDTSSDESFDVDTRCNTRLRNPSTPPRPRVVDLYGSGADNKDQCNKRQNNSDYQCVNIETPSPDVGLVRSSQVLQTFRTWLDSDEVRLEDEVPNASAQNEVSILNRDAKDNSSQNSANTSATNRWSETPSSQTKTRTCVYGTLKSQHVFPNSIGARKSVENQLPSLSVDSSCEDRKSEKSTADVSKSNGQDNITVASCHSNNKVQNENNGANETTDDNAMDCVSSANQCLNERTSENLKKDITLSSTVEENVSSSLISQLTKPRNSRIKIRRVQSMKETSTRRREKRRVDWGPCVQIHFYDPESEIDSENDHVCRTTAMDFANTLEYEGSLV